MLVAGRRLVLWIAYAGLNVCLPNLMLKLSPREANAFVHCSFSGRKRTVYAASSILGGVIVDACKDWTVPLGETLWLSFSLPFSFSAGSRGVRPRCCSCGSSSPSPESEKSDTNASPTVRIVIEQRG